MTSKVKQYKGFKIVMNHEERYDIFTKEEYSYGKGYRSAEHDAGSIEEAMEYIDCYEQF